MKDEIETLRNTVIKVLTENQAARDSDKVLILEVLRELGFKIYINSRDLLNMPSFESISRCRRLIQAENEQLGASTETKEYRDKRLELVRTISLESERGERGIISKPNFVRARNTVTV
jgi:hypothetical protein